MTKLQQIILTSLFLFATIFSASSQALSERDLAREGTRIGRAYHMALRNGDVELQNDALSQFNEILITLRKQSQADIFTNAFNRANILISSPVTDVKLYTQTTMKALLSGDSIAISDAQDIALTVKQIYASERDSSEAEYYALLYDANVKCGTLGNLLSKSSDNDKISLYKNEAEQLKKQFSSDTTAVKVLENTFEYFSVAITTPRNDADKYIDAHKKAVLENNADRAESIRRKIQITYSRYQIERNKDEAELFRTLIDQCSMKE